MLLVPIWRHCEVEAVGTAAVAGHGVPADPVLDLGHVVDRDAPGHPAATGLGALTDGLAEGGLVRRRVVEDLDDLEVLTVLERQDHVAGAEPGVGPAVEERGAQQADPSSAVVPARPSRPTANET